MLPINHYAKSSAMNQKMRLLSHSITQISRFIFLLLCFFSLSLLTSCIEDDEPVVASGNKFLVASGGSATVKAGLYEYDVTKNSFDHVSDYYPHYLSLEYLDYNNNRVAFTTDIKPAESSCIAYADINNWAGLKFVPIPATGDPESYFAVPTAIRPRVLKDGKIVYNVVWNTSNPWDDYHIGQLAIYDPATNNIELSGDPSGFVLAQPEKGADTEGGSMSGAFDVSPDGKYVYCQVYGYGTSWGQYHIDYKFIVSYEVGKPGSYKRIAQSYETISGVTGNGKYLVLSGDGLRKIDLSSNALEKFDDYPNTFSPNQVSKNSSKMIKMWRGSGCGLFDLDDAAPWQFTIIDGSKLSGSYRGLGHGLQFSPDESKIIFTASSDFNTNYASPLRVFSCPVAENITKPDSIGTMPVEYCTGVFLLLNK